jgi:phosphomannomutase
VAADVFAAARAWAARDPDPDTRAEVDTLLAAHDAVALADRFGARLEFGTAGLRGELGAGPNRMNRALVRRVAAGLARYLGTGARVVIGYDGRHKSHDFALDSAAVFTAAGLDAHLMPGPLPTPMTAFAVRHLGCAAGVMVTASHNPPRDNGYKVYLGDGAQIVPPADHDISAAIDAVDAEDVDPPLADGYAILDESIVDAYLDHTLALVAPGPRALRIVYTPLHGVGGAVAREAFHRAGFDDVHVVARQAEPDPDFPTTPFPNPEEPGTLDLALADAMRVDADIVIANDPDADRLAVAVGGRRLTGDEVGSLLGHHLLSTRGAEGGRERLVVTSIVSSSRLERIAADLGAHCERTFTGFKWIVRPALAHPEWRFVFGYEEALGYLVGDGKDEAVRDKDGISAALVIAELAAALKEEGKTLLDRLAELDARYGAYHTAQRSFRLPPDAQARVMETVRRLDGAEDLRPAADVVILERPEGRIVYRPSGTEPKLKLYAETVGGDAGALADTAARWAGLGDPSR